MIARRREAWQVLALSGFLALPAAFGVTMAGRAAFTLPQGFWTTPQYGEAAAAYAFASVGALAGLAFVVVAGVGAMCTLAATAPRPRR